MTGMTVGVRIEHLKKKNIRKILPMSQIKLANFLKLGMFFVFGVSAFLQVNENQKDFKPAKRQKPPIPYPHKVYLMSVGLRGSGDGSRRF